MWRQEITKGSALKTREVPSKNTLALDYVRGRVPLYTLSDVADLVGVPASTLGTWANGYVRFPAGRPTVSGGPMITRIPGMGQGPSIPFIGLAEAMTLAALRRTKHVPMPKIRRVVDELQIKLGLEHALASERLYLVGATLVYDLARDNSNDPDLMELVEVENQQAVWTDAVREYLVRVSWDEGGWPERIPVPRYPTADVVVDPYHGSGSPYFAGNGVPVSGIVGRARGGDPVELLAADYGLDAARIQEVLDNQLEPAA